MDGMASSVSTQSRGYSATKEQLLTRLRLIEGQVRGVEGMVDEERYCIDVLTQISAIQAALDKVALGLLDDHAHRCVIGAEAAEQTDKTEELMAAVGRLGSRRRMRDLALSTRARAALEYPIPIAVRLRNALAPR